MSKRILAFLGGVVLATGLGATAVTGDDPLVLAFAAAIAFVSAGHVMPARGLMPLIARRQPVRTAAASRAFVFAFLGIALVWASITALDTTLPSLRVVGWGALACFIATGAVIVATYRFAEELAAGRAEEPRS
ncbi:MULTISPECIES: hypothetical protein [unclassified Kribbella]|uniref:hypothetical protein n=1 Tax=unclassified Kribbella TaxID=2644121 RepID=UPI0033D8A5D2